jgi:DNA-binding MarR family transcriptional regulator
MTEKEQNEVLKITQGLRASREIFKNLVKGFDPETGVEGLNSTHYRTLVALDEWGKDCMKRLCSRIGLEAGSFTPVADKLMNEGLVARIPDDRDRRKTQLSLTPEGEKLAQSLKVQMGLHFRGQLNVLEPDLYKQFQDALDLMMVVNGIIKDKHE